ncbi:hypothetical protein M9H77_03105 [Catharanthus roseus]|uniref:Uncharacterized protein n=1 Tax=Catharanthus roseus TaxID=4058 RepID=A0ACC0CA96_CATRO|nr:hypothetical protein M9H77_03105 [Catharanthus roseus]
MVGRTLLSLAGFCPPTPVLQRNPLVMLGQLTLADRKLSLDGKAIPISGQKLPYSLTPRGKSLFSLTNYEPSKIRSDPTICGWVLSGNAHVAKEPTGGSRLAHLAQ